MADSTTTNYGLTKPEVGASEDTWGAKVNTDMDLIDTQMKASANAIVATVAVANAALSRAGGAMTGAITTNSTFDGRDVAADGVTADAALPKAGGTMTGVIAGFTSTGIDDNATSTAITIDASENVGIGTVSPAYRLDVVGDSSTKVLTRVDNTNQSTSTGSGIRFDSSVAGGTQTAQIYTSCPSNNNVNITMLTYYVNITITMVSYFIIKSYFNIQVFNT
jgi:hypothetical protein